MKQRNHNNHGLLEIEIVVKPKLVVAINIIERCSAVTQIEMIFCSTFLLNFITQIIAKSLKTTKKEYGMEFAEDRCVNLNY